MIVPIEAEIAACKGLPIGRLCGNHFDSISENHCAHFVSHALGIRAGTLCGDLRASTRHTGATIRCDELFNSLARRGAWEDRPMCSAPLLIFIIARRHVVGNVMTNAREKHVGVVFAGPVYNYSNTLQRVVADPSADEFLGKFARSYQASDAALFYAVPR